MRRLLWLVPVAFIAGIAFWQVTSVTPPGMKCTIPGSGPNGGPLLGVPPYGCTGPVHFVLHGLGVDTQVGYFYGFASGSGPMFLTLLVSLTVFGTAVAAYKRWSCQESFWCFRHGKHTLTDPATGETHHYCWRHHPGGHSKHWDAAKRLEIWEQHLLHHQPKPAPHDP